MHVEYQACMGSTKHVVVLRLTHAATHRRPDCPDPQAWNGRYVKVTPGTTAYGGYTLPNCGVAGGCDLYAQAGVWRLAIEGVELKYTARARSALPPLTGWQVNNGTKPAPTLVAGPV